MSEEEKPSESSDAASDQEAAGAAESSSESESRESAAPETKDTKSKLAAARGGAKKKDPQSKLAAARAGGKSGTQGKLAAARAAKGGGGASKLAAARAAGGSKAKEGSEGGAGGTKAAPKKPAGPPKKPKAPSEPVTRRAFPMVLLSWFALSWIFFTAACTAMLAGAARFMFPNWLREPPSKFKIGSPGEYPPGTVATKWKAQFGIWVVNTEYNGAPQICALRTVCTHLGCTPNWLEGEQKFKCPCHGSGFRASGINFEGPAPRPLERYAIRLADDGQLEVDKSQMFQEEMGQWQNPSSFVVV